MERSKKKLSFSRLFGNKRFSLVFSILLAFVIWAVMMYSNTEMSSGFFHAAHIR